LSIVKKGIELIVFSNLWIATSASGLTLNTYLLLGKQVNFLVVFLVFLATFSIYNLQRLIKHHFQNKNYSKRHHWILKHIKVLILLVAISSLGSVFLFFKVYSFQYFLYLLPFSIVSVLYGVTLFSENKSLRDLPFTKIFLIAITWAVTSVVLPFIELDLAFNVLFVQLFLFNFLFMLAITIPFDIRDIKLDSESTKTLPQYLGIEKSISLSIWLLSACLILAIVSFFTISQILPLVFALVLVSKSKVEQPELFYSGLIDGLALLFPFFGYLIG